MSKDLILVQVTLGLVRVGSACGVYAIATLFFVSLSSDSATCVKMLVYGKFSLFLENVAVRSYAFSPLDSVPSLQPGSVDLYLRARYIISFGYFIDRESGVLPGEVENWPPKVGFPRSAPLDGEADLHSLAWIVLSILCHCTPYKADC